MKSMMLQSIPTLDYATNEAINTLATNVIFSGEGYKAIMVTSCDKGEGKSFITFELAQKLAVMGYSVVMVDCDIRRSVFCSCYQVAMQKPAYGLTHYLAGRCEEEQVIYSSNITGLDIVPAGKEVINSLPLLNSTAFGNLMSHLRSSYDFILVDAPPVGLIVDAAMIASSCDGTIFTITSEKVSRREVKSALQQIEKSGCAVLGVVLNKVSMDTHKSRRYYYKSYYSHYGDEYTKAADVKPAPAAKPQDKVGES